MERAPSRAAVGACSDHRHPRSKLLREAAATPYGLDPATQRADVIQLSFERCESVGQHALFLSDRREHRFEPRKTGFELESLRLRELVSG